MAQLVASHPTTVTQAATTNPHSTPAAPQQHSNAADNSSSTPAGQPPSPYSPQQLSQDDRMSAFASPAALAALAEEPPSSPAREEPSAIEEPEDVKPGACNRLAEQWQQMAAACMQPILDAEGNAPSNSAKQDRTAAALHSTAAVQGVIVAGDDVSQMLHAARQQLSVACQCLAFLSCTLHRWEKADGTDSGGGRPWRYVVVCDCAVLCVCKRGKQWAWAISVQGQRP